MDLVGMTKRKTGEKGRNTPTFNIMSKKRRKKAKHDAKNRKKNQIIARRRRK